MISVLLVAVDAVIITISGRKYLSDGARPSMSVAASRLTTTLFTLIVLGLIALISTIDVPVDGELQNTVTKLGIVLLLLAVAHAITMTVLARYRGEERQEHLTEELDEQRRGRTRNPQVGTSIERGEPYKTM